MPSNIPTVRIRGQQRSQEARLRHGKSLLAALADHHRLALDAGHLPQVGEYVFPSIFLGWRLGRPGNSGRSVWAVKGMGNTVQVTPLVS
jgi:hypothetical protein